MVAAHCMLISVRAWVKVRAQVKAQVKARVKARVKAWVQKGLTLEPEWQQYPEYLLA